jgi:hypothetical protein
MCLFKDTRHHTKIKATEDIVVYKFLVTCPDGSLRSPYMPNFKWDIGKEYTANRAKFVHYTTVKDGYFHSYRRETDAHRRRQIYGAPEANVYKCIIPKGSYYYVGYDPVWLDCFASKKLKIIERV